MRRALAPFIGIGLMVLGLFLRPGPEGWLERTAVAGLAGIALTAAALSLALKSMPEFVRHVLAALALCAGSAAPLLQLRGAGPFGTDAPGLWFFVAGWSVWLCWKCWS